MKGAIGAARYVAWRDIDVLWVAGVRGARVVAYAYRDARRPADLGQLSAFRHKVGGADSQIPSDLALEPNSLASLMNEMRARAVGATPP